MSVAVLEMTLTLRAGEAERTHQRGAPGRLAVEIQVPEGPVLPRAPLPSALGDRSLCTPRKADVT